VIFENVVNPIALSSPDGTVYSYACGHCKNVQGGTYKYGQREQPDPYITENYRAHAERCCTCDRCGQFRNNFGLYCEACEPIKQAELEVIRAKNEERHRQEQEIRDLSLKAAKDVDAARLLVVLMRDISESTWCAGWLMGLEHILWDAMQAGPKEDSEFVENDLARLRKLHEQAGGWWVWTKDVGEVFIATDAWLASKEERRNADVF
jgi:hypothetical protein